MPGGEGRLSRGNSICKGTEALKVMARSRISRQAERCGDVG